VVALENEFNLLDLIYEWHKQIVQLHCFINCGVGKNISSGEYKQYSFIVVHKLL
jgi:hypothetical protein